MPTEIEEPRTEHEHAEEGLDPQEFEGGPVKTFLEHLEDLRWVLIKTGSAIGVAFVVCLLAGPQVTTILKYSLARSKIKHPKNVQNVSFYMATNRVWKFQLPLNASAPFIFGTNQVVS